VAKAADTPRALRALWALHNTTAAGPNELEVYFKHADPRVRAWAVRLLVDRGAQTAEAAKCLAPLAASEADPIVRVALAGALQRLRPVDRWPLAEGLVSRAVEPDDQVLPLMIWYGVEPLAVVDVNRTAELIGRCQIPLVRQYLVRRLVDRDDKELAEVLPPLAAWLKQQTDPIVVRDVLQGMHGAWRGRRSVPQPANWADEKRFQALHDDQQVIWFDMVVSARMGVEDARYRLMIVALTRESPTERRQEALTALVEMRYAPLGPNLRQLLADRAMRAAAIRALSAFDDADTPLKLLVIYNEMSAEEQTDAIATLASRAGYAELLLDAVKSGRIPKGDVSLTIVRQLRGFKRPAIDSGIEKIWGALQPPSKEKQQIKLRWQQQLTPQVLAEANLGHGRALFAKTCANCHVLFDDGKRIGPELTGAQRTNLDYVLENVLDPSAAVARAYQMTQVVLLDGRLLTGIVLEESDQTLTLQMPTERLSLSKADIDERAQSKLSMMPEGILNAFSPTDVRDLVGYLASPAQVPLPDEPVAE
jgi:putative heme-binding domain-containing protein